MNRKNLKEKPLPLVESIIDQSSLLPRFEIRTKGESFFIGAKFQETINKNMRR